MKLPALLLLATVAWPAPESTAHDPLAPLPAARWTPAAAAHLLRRAGFGATPAGIDEFHALGLRGAVDRLLGWEGQPDPDVPGLALAVTARPGREEFRRAATPEERQKLRRDYRRRDAYQLGVIREWWIQTMVRTRWPLRERLALYWHGHFTSGYRDVRNSYHMYVQNTLFRRFAAGNFRTLLHEVGKDPAMLEYLDNNRNRKEHPNENFAREVMELFTLGAGNYTEQDIHEAARALTGWTFSGNRFRFDPRRHDDGVKTILGRTGNFDGDAFLDLVLEQPAAPRFLAARMFRYFAHDDPPPRVVEGLARTLLRHDWELAPMLRQLFSSREFYSARSVGRRIKGPVELLVGLFRSLDMDPRPHAGLAVLAGVLGQSLMDPPNVQGWPGGRDWITTSTLLRRYNVCGALAGTPRDQLRAVRNLDGREARAMRVLQRARRVDPNGEEMDGALDAGMDMGGGMARRFSGRRGRPAAPPAYDAVAHVRALGLETAPAIVDHFARALFAQPPSERLRTALLDALVRDGGFELDAGDAGERLHALLRLSVSTPEFQLD